MIRMLYCLRCNDIHGFGFDDVGATAEHPNCRPCPCCKHTATADRREVERLRKCLAEAASRLHVHSGVTGQLAERLGSVREDNP